MILPREHGAWSMLLLPFAAGLFVAERREWTAIPAAVALLAAFVLREPLVILARQALVWRERRPETAEAKRTAIIAGAALVAAGAVLLSTLPLVPLLALGAAGAALTLLAVWLTLRNRQRALWFQFATTASLGASALLASLACERRIATWAWILWGLSSLHAAGGIAVVRARLEAKIAARSGAPLRLTKPAATVVAVQLAVAVLLAPHWWLVAAMAASAALHAYELLRLRDPEALATPLTRVGLRAMTASILFTALVAAGLA